MRHCAAAVTDCIQVLKHVHSNCKQVQLAIFRERQQRSLTFSKLGWNMKQVAASSLGQYVCHYFCNWSM